MKSKVTSYSVEKINAQYGKLPPQAVEVEEAVLGAIILESEAYSKVSSILSDTSFYKDEHQKIFVRIKELHDAGRPIDMMQVVQSFKDNEELDLIGGPGYIAELVSNVSSAGHIEHWARIVQQKFIQRELIRVSEEIKSSAYDDSLDVTETIESASNKIADLFVTPETNIQTVKELLVSMHERIKLNYFSENNITGFATGIPKLDKHTGGFQKTDFTVIAAETGQGKTSFAITITNNTTSLGNLVGFISIEMPAVQLIIKITSQETGISSGAIFKEKLSDKDVGIIESMDKKTETKLLYIDDKSKTLESIVNSIRYMHRKFGVELFFIDYIQLIVIDGMSQEDRLAKVSRTLANLAKELVINITALSQLKRSVGGSINHQPSIDRLRGSGQIEEAAVNIILIWRPEEYGVEYFDDDGYISTEGKASIDFAKGRNIGTEKFIINFIKNVGLFLEDNSGSKSNPNQFIESNCSPF